ncbi:MAG: cytoplasmic protein [Phycisphaerae bacterium]
MALSSNRELKFYASQELIDVPVDDDVNIYKGAFVGSNSSTGYARPLVAGDDFAGVAYKQADNTVAGHTAGGIDVRLHQSIDIVHALSGVANTDIGSVVYASDDGTLTLTATNNSRIGRIVAIEGTDLVRVRCQPIASLTS